MKTLFLLTITTFLTVYTSFAQTKAVTENGDEVILYNDGTWKYKKQNEATQGQQSSIYTNPKKFKKDKDATFLLKSNNIDVGFWLDPSVWSFQKEIETPDIEFELELKDGDLYAMIITEEVEMPLDVLGDIAVENARDAAPDVEVMEREYRTVNGHQVLLQKINGTMQGIKFSYYGYYYSSEKGSVQFVTFTSQNLLDKYMDECETLLNGLVEL